jgi:hypothetical protein
MPSQLEEGCSSKATFCYLLSQGLRKILEKDHKIFTEEENMTAKFRSISRPYEMMGDKASNTKRMAHLVVTPTKSAYREVLVHRLYSLCEPVVIIHV